jgi:hypothetical protein
MKAEQNENNYYVPDSLHIPGIILKLWGKLDLKKYELLKRNSSWLAIKARVC